MANIDARIALSGVYTKIDARIAFYTVAIDHCIAKLAGLTVDSPEIATIATEVAHYGMVRAELQLLKESL